MRSSFFRDVMQRWLVVTDVLEQPVVPIFKGQAVYRLNPEDGHDRLSQTAGNYKSTLCSMPAERRSQNKQFADSDTEETALAPDTALDMCSSDMCSEYRLGHRLNNDLRQYLFLRWHCSAKLTLAFSQSATSFIFGLSFHFLILHLLTSVLHNSIISSWSSS